jgi:hypothetical protein
MNPLCNRLLVNAILFSAMLFGCQPEVEKPAIENCLITKIDGLDLVPVTVNGQNAPPLITTRSTVFTYDANSRPITFSYYYDSQLNGYAQVTYNQDGTLKEGVDYNESRVKTGVRKYEYSTKEKELLVLQSSYQPNGTTITSFTSYEYNPQKMVSLSTRLNADYETFTFETFSYRYEYDTRNNLTKRYIRYLSRVWTGIPSASIFLETLLNDLKKQPEVLTTTLSGYDDKYNPYRSQATLAILFDDLPAFNNAKTITYHYRDTGTKYADLTYTFQCNRKGFPYIYTVATDYTNDYTTRTGIKDYTNTSSYEYKCK